MAVLGLQQLWSDVKTTGGHINICTYFVFEPEYIPWGRTWGVTDCAATQYDTIVCI